MLDSLYYLKLAEAKKAQLGLLAALVAVNIVGVVMNSKLQNSLGSKCSVYVAEQGTTVLNSASEYNHKQLFEFAASNSIPRWVNPSWRIPSISVVDAGGAKDYIQGAMVLNSNDDQYSVRGPKCTQALVEKLEAVDVSSMKFPITLKWTQIEGADVLRVLKCHYAFLGMTLVWVGGLAAVSHKGYQFFQNYMMLAAFACVWFAGSIRTASEALQHPPSGAEIADIPADAMGSIMQACHYDAFAAGYMGTVCLTLALQGLIVTVLVPVGRRVASATNEANGTKDPWILGN